MAVFQTGKREKDRPSSKTPTKTRCQEFAARKRTQAITMRSSRAARNLFLP